MSCVMEGGHTYTYIHTYIHTKPSIYAGIVLRAIYIQCTRLCYSHSPYTAAEHREEGKRG